MAERLLEVQHLSKTFPGLRALDNVSLSVDSGEIVAVVGQNGSGKSTLVKILAGVHQPDPGARIRIGAEGQAGLHFIHQDLGLVGALSTIENLDLSRQLGSSGLLPARVRAETRHAEDLIAEFGGSFDVRAPVDRLSAAERTIVAIARALDAWENDRNVLVLDEPTAALHGEEAKRLFVAVRRVAKRGAGVVFISHRLDEVVELADRVLCLRDGKLIADVRRGEFDHGDLVELITGAALAEAANATSRRAGRVVLRARSIKAPTIVELDLELRAGEILGVSGVLGSGREEVAQTLFGAGIGSATELEVDGRVIAGRFDPRRAIAIGLAYLPGDRHTSGAVMTMTVRENMTLPRLNSLRGLFGKLRQGDERAEVGGWMQRLEVRPAEPERALELFSGGNQQKVLLAKWLRIQPKVLLLDEPTQGVDVGAKAGIFELIANAAAAGAGVLVCSSDAKELALICDRVLVMRDGRAVAQIDRPQLSEAGLVRAGLGVDRTDSARSAA